MNKFFIIGLIGIIGIIGIGTQLAGSSSDDGMIRAMNLFIDFASGDYREWYDPYLESIGGSTMINQSYPEVNNG